MISRSVSVYEETKRRRTVREFSSRPVPMEVINNCLLTAGTAPNGANHQPWHFAVVTSPDLKQKIRRAAEVEEQAFYGGRAPDDWLAALEPLGTDENKPFLEDAPALIVVFGENYGLDENGEKIKNYYVTESVGIATGFLISALHHCGLATLTHTPSPMGFLREILGRSERERAFLILVVGYPQDGVQVPDIQKKSLSEIATFHS
jgi:iodotyrosine deiodinase